MFRCGLHATIVWCYKIFYQDKGLTLLGCSASDACLYANPRFYSTHTCMQLCGCLVTGIRYLVISIKEQIKAPF